MRLLWAKLSSSERSISLVSLHLQVQTGSKILSDHGVLDKTFMSLKFKVYLRVDAGGGKQMWKLLHHGHTLKQ